MSDLKTTLREFKEYLALSYESPLTIAARIGVSQATVGDWLSGRHPPKAKSLAKLRRFLDTEAKRPAQGDGIRPVEPVPYKSTRPTRQVRYARLCSFCRKARGKIRKLGATSFQGTCPKCGASGPTRERDTRKHYELGMGENKRGTRPCVAGTRCLKSGAPPRQFLPDFTS